MLKCFLKPGGVTLAQGEQEVFTVSSVAGGGVGKVFFKEVVRDFSMIGFVVLDLCQVCASSGKSWRVG